MHINKRLCLVLLIGLLAFTSLPVLAVTDQQRKMLDQLDQLDHQEFSAQTEKAYSCIHARDFGCAEKKIAKAAKYVTNPQDRTTLRRAKQDLAAERRYQQEELAAAAERARQIQLAQARAAQEEADRRQRERQREEAEERNNNIRGGLAILSGTAAGYATRHYAPDQQSRIMTSTMDAVYNGNVDGLNSTLNQVSSEREQEHNEKMQQIREQKARDEHAAQARREREEREERATRAQKEREQHAARSQREREERSAAQRRAQEAERLRQAQAKRPPVQVPQYVPQQVTIPTWSQTCPPGYSPARHSNGVSKAAAPGGYCIKDPVQTAKLQVNQGPGAGTASSPSNPAAGASNAAGTSNKAPRNPATRQVKDESAGNRTSTSGAGSANVAGTGNSAPKVPAAKKLFRKIPADPPRGSAPGGKVKGIESYTTEGVTYSCQGINSYGHQHKEEVELLVKAYFDSPYASDERCQNWCDLLNRREEVLSTFHYTGSWSCTNTAMGQWLGTDQYSSYHNGQNGNRCTCVTANDTPIIFSPAPK